MSDAAGDPRPDLAGPEGKPAPVDAGEVCPSSEGCEASGDRRCAAGSGAWQACVRDGFGCRTWSDPIPCAPDEVCVEGACVASCLPACQGRACGPDGCGGSCGECPEGMLCQQGACAMAPPPVVTCFPGQDDLLAAPWHLEDDTGRFGPAPWSWNGVLDQACEVHAFLIAGARDMQVAVRVEGSKPLRPRVLVADVAAWTGRRPGTTINDQAAAEAAPHAVEARFVMPSSGEVLVLVTADPFQHAGAYRLEAACEAFCEASFTRFPIVLLHGMAGWDSILNVYSYFLGVQDDLRARGYQVDTTEVAALQDTLARATELEAQLLEILKDTAARKLNLLAHSQGGLDARHFISGQGHGDDVAALATVATPHYGSVLGDKVLGLVGQGLASDVLGGIVDFFADLIGGHENDVVAGFQAVSVDYVTNTFNPQHPDHPGVTYWSWAGESCPLLDGACQDAHDGETIFPALAITYALIADCPEGVTLGCGPNDGIVPSNSAHWGTFWGTLNADHWDEIGQFKTGSLDHIGLYRKIAGMLRDHGF